MKIILSRKGFDTASGGRPSPIFPDGRMLSLPIPDDQSQICYQDIHWQGFDVGSLVSGLTGGRVTARNKAHLDPDLSFSSLPRLPGWRPIFGQTGAAQGHLRLNGVGPGDIFLFFGLFQEVVKRASGWIWEARSPRRHVLWGWMRIGEALKVEDCNRTKYRWAAYHPHFQRAPEANNTVYLTRQFLSLPESAPTGLSGAGVFMHFSEGLRLTSAGATQPSLWELPEWFYPVDGRRPLTYHRDFSRWQRTRNKVQLRSASRGQEFILDTEQYPEAVGWVRSLLAETMKT